MADIATEVVARLKNVSAVTALVGSGTSHRGWTQDGVPQARQRPNYTVTILGQAVVSSLSGPTALRSALVQVTAFADTVDGRNTLAEAIFTGLASTGGTWGSTTVTECYCEETGVDSDTLPTDASDQRIYYRQSNFRIWYYTS